MVILRETKRTIDIKTDFWANMWRHAPRFPFSAIFKPIVCTGPKMQVLDFARPTGFCIVVLFFILN